MTILTDSEWPFFAENPNDNFIGYYYDNSEIHWLSKCQDKYLNELHYVFCSHISFVPLDHQFAKKKQEFVG